MLYKIFCIKHLFLDQGKYIWQLATVSHSGLEPPFDTKLGSMVFGVDSNFHLTLTVDQNVA